MATVKKEERYRISTDGGCRPNPGPGGYGVVARKGEVVTEINKGYFHTTNNRMEMMAVIAALEEFGPGLKADIYTDSQYTINGTKWMRGWARNGWRTYKTGEPIKNKDLWVILNDLLKKNKIKFFWVKGHSGDVDNERADKLATEALLAPEVQDLEYLKTLGLA